MCSTHEPLCQDFMRLLYAAFLPSHLQSTAIGKDNWRGTQKYCGFMFPTALTFFVCIKTICGRSSYTRDPKVVAQLAYQGA